MRILLLGAGFAGFHLTKKLVANERINKIVVVDKDKAKTNKIKKLSDKVAAYNLDARKIEKLSSFIYRSDLTISLLPPNNSSIEIIKACIDEGSNYMDLGISDYTLFFTINHESVFKDAGLLALPSYGADPGLTNVIARNISKKFEKINRITIRDGSVTYDNDGNYYVYSPSIFAQEIIEKPLVFREGRYVRLDISEAIEEFEFPENVGLRKVWLVSHEEVITLPKFLNKELESLDFGYYVPNEIQKDLMKSIIEGEDFEIKSAKPFNDENNYKIEGYELLVVDVIGKYKNEEIKSRGYVCLRHKDSILRFNENATAFLITLLPVEVIDMLAKKELKGSGILLPEMLNPEPIISKLKKLGIYQEKEILIEKTHPTR